MGDDGQYTYSVVPNWDVLPLNDQEIIVNSNIASGSNSCFTTPLSDPLRINTPKKSISNATISKVKSLCENETVRIPKVGEKRKTTDQPEALFIKNETLTSINYFEA